MSKSGNILAFLAGGAIGAALIYLSCTERGRRMAKSGMESAAQLADNVLEKVEEVKQSINKDEED